MSALVETLRMIKVEHSVFALPFALASAFVAAAGVPEVRTLVLILVAMVSARSAAMAFNRYLDAEIDGRNPRTANRSIPAGRLGRGYALGFTVVCAAVFALSAYLLNPLTFALAPLALLVLLGYSATKRFTSLSHFALGLALGLAPVGAWVAVRGSFSWDPMVLGLAVLGWTAGFDLIYACQDVDFDRQEGLRSIPARIGVHRALMFARVLHLAMLGLLGLLGVYWHAHWVYWLGIGVVGVVLVYEHSLVRNDDLTRVDMAFFTLNGIVSLLFGGATVLAVVLK